MSPPPVPPPNALEFDLDPEDFVDTAERRSTRMEAVTDGRSVAIPLVALGEDAEATTAFEAHSRARLDAALESLSALPGANHAPNRQAALVDFDDADTSFLAPRSLAPIPPAPRLPSAEEAPTNDLGRHSTGAAPKPLRSVPLSSPPRSLRYAAPRPEFDDLPTRVGESLPGASQASFRAPVSPDFDDIPTKFESERSAADRANSMRDPYVEAAGDDEDLVATAQRPSAASLAAELSFPRPSRALVDAAAPGPRPSLRPSIRPSVRLAAAAPASMPPPAPRSPFASAPPAKRQTLAPPIPPVSAMRASAPPPPPAPAPPPPVLSPDDPLTGALDMAALASRLQPRSAPPPPNSFDSTLRSAPLPPPGELMTPPPPAYSGTNLPVPPPAYSAAALVPPAQASGYLPGYADPVGYAPPPLTAAYPAAPPVDATANQAQRVRMAAIGVLVVIVIALFAKSFATPAPIVVAPATTPATPTATTHATAPTTATATTPPTQTALPIDALPLATPSAATASVPAPPPTAAKPTPPAQARPAPATPATAKPVTTAAPPPKPKPAPKNGGSILNDAL